MSTNEHVKVLEPMANTMDKLRELGERMVARSQHCENTKDAIAMQEHAAELDAILRESEAQGDAGAVNAKAWLLDVMGTWDFTMPTRAFDEIVNRIAASATPRTEPAEGREAAWPVPSQECYSGDDGDTWWDSPSDIEFVHGRKVGDEFVLMVSHRAVERRYRVTKTPDGTSDDYEVESVGTPPAVASVRVTDAERHDMERKARELLAVEYERRGSRRMAEGIRSTPAAEFGDRDLGCAVRAIVAALAAQRQEPTT